MQRSRSLPAAPTAPRSTRRRVGLVACALAAALATAGCGSASNSGAGARVSLLRAADVTNAAAGYRMAMRIAISTSSLPGPIDASGTGSFDPAAHTGQLTMAMDFGSNPQVAAALGGSTLRLREILDGGNIYLGLPASLAARLPGARPWLLINLSQAAAKAGIPGFSSLLDNPTSTNPALFLQYLRAVSGGVRRIGSATIDGHRTTGYRATIDLSKAAKAAPPGQRAAVAQAVGAVERLSGITRIPVEAWVDANHLVRRMSISLTERPQASGQKVTSAITVDMLSYGPQPKPQLPPASQVTNLSSLTGAAG